MHFTIAAVVLCVNAMLQEWQARCLSALYRFMGIGMPDPTIDMHSHLHMPPHAPQMPPIGHPSDAPQSDHQQRVVFEPATPFYEIARQAPHGLGAAPVRKAM